MTGEEIFGMIIMLGVCLGCGFLFYGIGLAAERSTNPFGFWTGREVKPEQISDIPAYNRENGRMWKHYAFPYFLACVFQILSIWFPELGWVSAGVIVLSSTAGIWWLIRRYRHIYRRYSIK